MTLYELKVDFRNGGHATVDSVLEFVAGYRYLYVRTPDSTMSFERGNIREVYRRVEGQDMWLPVVMRKARRRLNGREK